MCAAKNQATENDNLSELQVLSNMLQTNIEKIQSDFGHSVDLVVNLVTFEKMEISFAGIYIKDMVDDEAINAISNALAELKNENKKMKPDFFFDTLMKSVAVIRETSKGSELSELYKEILNGNMSFIIDGCDRFISVSTPSHEGRAISEPTSQTIIKGPKDSFTDNIDKNLYLIRSKIRNEALRVEAVTLGTTTHTKVIILYLNGIAKADIVDDLRSRVSKIDYDGILSTGYIEEIIKSDPHSIFPTSLHSERPDAVTADLIEGRVAIMSDGSPFVLTAPTLFGDFLQASDDYYQNFYATSLMRLIRYLALLLTLLTPALYIALTTFHQEIIPTPLLISIAVQREGVPFPVLIEILIMDIVFEILREAGVRMPRAIGSAISIVGALVLGQAAVEAGIVAAATVIVVALTAISSFAITNYAMSNAIRILRFIFIFLAGMLGIYGISIGLIILVLHLCKLKSASVPYLSPIAPIVKSGLRDSILRFPLLKLKSRPAGISGTGTTRTNGQYTMDPKIKEKPELR